MCLYIVCYGDNVGSKMFQTEYNIRNGTKLNLLYNKTLYGSVYTVQSHTELSFKLEVSLIFTRLTFKHLSQNMKLSFISILTSFKMTQFGSICESPTGSRITV